MDNTDINFSDDLTRDDLIRIIELFAKTIDQNDFNGASALFVSEIARLFACERVSIGFLTDGQMRVKSLSNCAHFEENVNLLRAVGVAMDEANDQHSTIAYHSSSESQKHIVRAHTELSENYNCNSIYTIPLCYNNEIFGAICLERNTDAKFTNHITNMLELLSNLIGPIIFLRKRVETNPLLQTWQALMVKCKAFCGPSFIKTKIITGCFGLIIIMAFFIKSDYRVTADASLEGRIQRMIASPINGYISVVNVRAGDIVKNGQIMAKLDDKELILQKNKLVGEVKQLRNEYRGAMAEHDRVKIGIQSAKLQQAKARLSLIEEQLNRLTFKAPFHGVVIEGDLDQSIGSPIEKGSILFKIAPLDNYRIILKIDESDIISIKNLQKGTLTLTSLPDETFNLTIHKITPVSIPKDGKNYFRIEALLNNPQPYLRPGMEGIGKVNVGERRTLWIWTHKLNDWLNLWLWKTLA